MRPGQRSVITRTGPGRFATLMSLCYDFLGVGGLSYDLTLQVERLPIADEKYPARFGGKRPGGFVANATCAAARLGLRAAYAGWAGDDAEGDMLAEDFRGRGVDAGGLVRVPGEPTPFTVVITDEHAGRAILLPGSPLYKMPLSAAQLALARKSRVVYTFPRDATWVQQLAQAAQDGGGMLALDVETAVPMAGPALRAAVELADVVFIPQSALAGIGAESVSALVRPGQWIVMTSGALGAQGIAHGMAEPVLRPARRVDAVDTTGAGDCFHAALIAARLDGASLPDALDFANAAAALKVQHRGARGGLPDRDAVAALLADDAD